MIDNGGFPAMKRYLLALVIVFPSLGNAGQDVEDIFERAKSYTAYIETRIQVPFIEDDQSSFFGAGFSVDHDRHWILTNAHVTGHSPAHITVTFEDGLELDAWPIYIDAYLDLAILEFEESDAVKRGEATLECKALPNTGHPVGAFGHPEGLKFTGTRGIISGITPMYGADWLQTDAPINSGNSGGPLISLETGRVVGINSATLAGGNVQSTNFAVMGTQACRVLELLLDGKDPGPPKLGITFYSVNDEPTLTVAQVSTEGTAIGFQRGDRIIGIRGQKLERATEGELTHQMRGNFSDLALEIERDGQIVSLPTVPDPRPDATARRGVYVDGAMFALTNHLDVESLDVNPVVMVHYIESGSIAEAAGIQTYDHLLAVDGKAVDGLDSFIDIIETHETDKLASMTLVRFMATRNRFLSDVLADMPLADARIIQFDQQSSRVAEEENAVVSNWSSTDPR
jgi:S1-C subfamily serine protease